MDSITGIGLTLSGAAATGSPDRRVFSASTLERGEVALRRWPAVVMVASVACAAGVWLWRGSAFEEPSARVQPRPAVAKSEPRAVRDRIAAPQPAPTGAGNALWQFGEAPAASRPGDAPIPPGNDARARAVARLRHPKPYAVPNPPLAPDAGADTQPGSAPAEGTSPPEAMSIVANPAPATNRWQAMRDEMAQCTGGLIEQVICEQRTRLRSCDGYWGKVAACPAGIPNDYGR